MKSLIKNWGDVENRIKKSGKVLFLLDFDGTLAPIAPTPNEAVLPQETKKIVQKLAEVAPVAIVSGRELKDVKKKVGLASRRMIYAGNHGSEWEIGGKYKRLKFDKKTGQAVDFARKEFKILMKSYPGTVIEEKGFAFAAHYRALDLRTEKKFLKDAEAVIAKSQQTKLVSVTSGKKLIDVKPKSASNKGIFSRFLLDYFNKKYKSKFTAIYLGDDKTDEDAFKALKAGITVFVGNGKAVSFAGYFLKNPTEVAEFLKRIYNIIK